MVTHVAVLHTGPQVLSQLYSLTQLCCCYSAYQNMIINALVKYFSNYTNTSSASAPWLHDHRLCPWTLLCAQCPWTIDPRLWPSQDLLARTQVGETELEICKMPEDEKLSVVRVVIILSRI